MKRSDKRAGNFNLKDLKDAELLNFDKIVFMHFSLRLLIRLT